MSGNQATGTWPGNESMLITPIDVNDTTYVSLGSRAVSLEDGNVYTRSGSAWTSYSSDVRDADFEYYQPGIAVEGDAFPAAFFAEIRDIMNVLHVVRLTPLVINATTGSVWSSYNDANAITNDRTYPTNNWTTTQTNEEASYDAHNGNWSLDVTNPVPKAVYSASGSSTSLPYSAWIERARSKTGVTPPWSHGAKYDFYARVSTPGVGGTFNANGSTGVTTANQYVNFSTVTNASIGTFVPPAPAVKSGFFGEGSTALPAGVFPTALGAWKGWEASLSDVQVVADLHVTGGYYYQM